MKKFRNILVVTAVAGSLITTPVLAAPSIDEIQKNKSEAENQLENANQKLVTLLTDFAVLKTDIANQEVKIQKADEDLQKAKAIEEKQYREMLVRIKYMYEKGDGSEAAALLGSDDFGEMINQAEYIQSVHTYDRKMLKKYEETKDQVAGLKSDLESDKADMVLMADTYKEQEQELQSTVAEMKSKVADFDSQLQEAQKQAEEEARRLAEETRRQQEAIAAQEAAKKQQQNSKPSGRNKPSNQKNNHKPSTQTSKPSAEENASSDKPSANAGALEEKPAPQPSNTSKGQQIANTGLKYVGNKYVYGGNSLTNGIDCSGFTQQIHQLCGIGGLPRSSGAQRSAGKAVNGLANALPGDVICYDGHVAIYLGGGRIVHASNPRPYPSGGIKTGSATYRTILAIRRYW